MTGSPYGTPGRYQPLGIHGLKQIVTSTERIQPDGHDGHDGPVSSSKNALGYLWIGLPLVYQKIYCTLCILCLVA